MFDYTSGEYSSNSYFVFNPCLSEPRIVGIEPVSDSPIFLYIYLVVLPKITMMKQVHKYIIGSYNSLKVWQQEFLMLYLKFLYSIQYCSRTQSSETRK